MSHYRGVIDESTRAFRARGTAAGAAGECFAEARQVRTSIDEEGRPQMLSMSLDDYSANTTPFFAASPFYEVETKRRIDRFGNIAHVWSHYEARTSPDAADVERRGINSIQLFNHPDTGWRIIHMIWDNEREGNELD